MQVRKQQLELDVEPQTGFVDAQTKRWAEGIMVSGPLAGGGSTTARGKLRNSSLCFLQPGILHDVLCIEVK